MEGSTLADTDWWQRHGEHVAGGRRVRFELFVRSLGPPIGAHGRQSEILERVDSLDRRGAVDIAEVRVWGDRVCVSECCSANPAVESIRAAIEGLRQWGEEKLDVSVDFERRSVRSTVAEEDHDVVDLPTICLAVSTDAGLEGVVPVTVGDERWTVEQYLDWFERVRTAPESRVLADA